MAAKLKLIERIIGPDRYRALMKRWVEARRRGGCQVPAVATEIYLTGEDKSLERSFPAAIKIEDSSRIECALVVTFKDEQSSLQRWIESLSKQLLKPAELVLVDGGDQLSIDPALEQSIHRAVSPGSLRLIHSAGCNIAEGRNIGVRESTSEIIAFTDLGCTMDSHWLSRLLAPFERNAAIELAMGWYEVVTRSEFAHCFSAYTVPRLNEIDVERFIPSARSFAIRREVFSKLKGFPEYLTVAGEDSLFGYYAHFLLSRAAFVPEAVVRWEFPDTAGGMFRMIQRYAAGDAEGGRIAWEHYLGLVRNIFRLPIVILRYPRRSNASRWQNVRAVSLLLVSQLCGFIQGYRRRRHVFSRRINGLRGVALLISSEPIASGNSELFEEFWRWLQMDYFIVNVYSLAGAAAAKGHRTFEHQRLLSFLRTEFDLDRFLTSVGKDILATKEFVVADLMRDGASRELKERIKKSFPNGDVREA